MQSFKNIALFWSLCFAIIAVIFMASDASAAAFEEDNEEVELQGDSDRAADSMDDMNTASENRQEKLKLHEIAED